MNKNMNPVDIHHHIIKMFLFVLRKYLLMIFPDNSINDYPGKSNQKC